MKCCFVLENNTLGGYDIVSNDIVIAHTESELSAYLFINNLREDV